MQVKLKKDRVSWRVLRLARRKFKERRPGRGKEAKQKPIRGLGLVICPIDRSKVLIRSKRPKPKSLKSRTSSRPLVLLRVFLQITLIRLTNAVYRPPHDSTGRIFYMTISTFAWKLPYDRDFWMYSK